MILCQDTNQKPCNKCKSCIEFDNNNNPDFYAISPDGNSIKVETIRKLINKTIEKPIISNRKVYIVNDSELMTIEAQNTLLKTLEEPPEYITIMLIVKNESQILNTIKSRCMRIVFKNIVDKELKIHLEENYNFKNISDNLLKLFNGSIEKVLNMKENQDLYNQLEYVFSNIEKIKKIDIIKSGSIIYELKENIIDILDYINIIFFKKITIKVDLDQPKSITNLRYINCIDIINNTKIRLDGNSNFDMTIDNMLLSIWEEINEKYSRG